MGAGLGGNVADDLRLCVRGVAEPRQTGPDFRNISKPVAGATGICGVMAALSRRRVTIAVGTRVGCDALGVIHQFCDNQHLLSCH